MDSPDEKQPPDVLTSDTENRTMIDPSDAKIRPFYERMKELGIPLLTHTGQERSFTSARDELAEAVAGVCRLVPYLDVIKPEIDQHVPMKTRTAFIVFLWRVQFVHTHEGKVPIPAPHPFAQVWPLGL